MHLAAHATRTREGFPMLYKHTNSFAVTLLISSIMLLTGCATTRSSNHHCDAANGCDAMASCDGLPSSGPFIRRGKENVVVDTIGRVMGLGNKLALMDLRADSHYISPSTEREVVRYLRSNSMNDVMLRLNQYDPIGEWDRLTKNKRIAAPFRYTVGTYDWLKYTLIPGRIVGGDWYSPYTNTIHLYSDIPSIGLSQAAYAKDVRNRHYPGVYAASQQLPGPQSVWSKALAQKEIVAYSGRTGGPRAAEDAKRMLSSDLAGSLGQQTLGFLPGGAVYSRAAGAAVNNAIRAATSTIGVGR